MENLNAEKVKSDLEKWLKNFDGKVTDFKTLAEALALINSQEQEKEKLGFLISELEKEKRELWEERNRIYNDLQDWKAIAEQYQKQFEDCAEDRAKLTEENERLIVTLKMNDAPFPEGLQIVHDFCEKGKREAKADTARKMQERLRECFDNEIEHKSIYTESQVLFVIDQIAKEVEEA